MNLAKEMKLVKFSIKYKKGQAELAQMALAHALSVDTDTIDTVRGTASTEISFDEDYEAEQLLKQAEESLANYQRNYVDAALFIISKKQLY